MTGLPENISGDGYRLLTDDGDTNIPGEAIAPNIFALSGCDSVVGTENADLISANEGADTLFGKGSDDLLFGGKASDFLDGGDGNDFICGDNNNDTLIGGDGNDVLQGGKGLDVLNGGAGDDVLIGDRHQDILIGGDGNDAFILPASQGTTQIELTDVIIDFSEGDAIGLSQGIAFADLSFEPVMLQLDGGIPVASTAIKTGDNYLAIVKGVPETELITTSFYL